MQNLSIRLKMAEEIKGLYMKRQSQNDICKQYPKMTQKQCSLVTQFWGFRRTRLIETPQNNSVLLQSQYDFLENI